MKLTITHTDGRTGPTWTCDDRQEAEALAAEHGYVILATTMTDNGDVYAVAA